MSMVPSGRAWEICCSLPRAEAGKTSIWYLLLVRLAISPAAQSASLWNASDVSYTWANFSLVWAAAGMATARVSRTTNAPSTRVRMCSSSLSDCACFWIRRTGNSFSGGSGCVMVFSWSGRHPPRIWIRRFATSHGQGTNTPPNGLSTAICPQARRGNTSPADVPIKVDRRACSGSRRRSHRRTWRYRLGDLKPFRPGGRTPTGRPLRAPLTDSGGSARCRSTRFRR